MLPRRGPFDSLGAGAVYRAAGDRYLLVEIGPNELDLDAALPRARARAGARAAAAARHHRHHARHPLAADPLRQPRAAARGADRRARRLRARSCRQLDDITHSDAHRAPAAVLGRSGDAARHREIHAVGARRCAVVPEQHRVHPAHQRARLDRRRARHRVRRELSRARARRRLPRRAGRDAGRSAAPAGHHEIQPRAHVDGRELGRASAAPTCASTAWKARRLSVRRPHGADVEHASRHARVRARLAVAAALLRSDPLLSGLGAKSCSRCATRSRTASISVDIEPGDVQPARAITRFSRHRGRERGLQAHAAGGFLAERERWAAAGQPEFVEPPDDLPAAAHVDVPKDARPCARR